MLSFSDFQKIAFSLCIDVGDAAPRPFGEAADDWQRADLEAILPAVARAIGIHDAPAGPARHWWERGRGHDKSSSAALIACAALAASERPITVILGAADEGQAALVHAAAAKLVRLNPVLDGKREAKPLGRGLLKVQEKRIIAPRSGSVCEVITSDAPSSWGLRPDVLIVDELSVWPARAEKFWESLFSAVGKKRTAAALVISNAGWKSSWQYGLRERVRVDPAWRFSRVEGVKASWLPPDLIDEQRRILPPAAFARVWENVWVDGSGDAIAPDRIDAAVRHAGPMTGSESAWSFYGGLDIGLKHDKTALVVIAVSHPRAVAMPERPPAAVPPVSPAIAALRDLGYLPEPTLPEPGDRPDFVEQPWRGTRRLAFVRTWKAPAGGQIDLAEIEDAVAALSQRFRVQRWAVDVWQAAFMLQRLRRRGIPAAEVPSSAAILREQASELLGLMNAGNLELYSGGEGGDLVADLRRLRVSELASGGFRIELPRDAGGHCDSASALLLALVAARRHGPLGVPMTVSGDVILSGAEACGFEDNFRRLRAPEWWEN